MKNIFDAAISTEITNRINQLNSNSQPKWGKMAVGQMLAHCNVTYEFLYDGIHKKPNAFKKFILKAFVKNIVVSEKPYKHNSQTAPEFIIKDTKNFESEKNRLVNYIHKTQQLGASHFDGLESHSFGALNKTEWNNMFYKHLDHHLNQFGV
ncbi:MAG: hypothetical protein RIQ33_448 [Bacteroidota bacterium]|jgi:hypothetical protein